MLVVYTKSMLDLRTKELESGKCGVIVISMCVSYVHKASRLVNFYILLSNSAPSGQTLTINYTQCQQYDGDVPLTGPVTVVCPQISTSYRYVILQTSISTQLCLNEVQVYTGEFSFIGRQYYEDKLTGFSCTWLNLFCGSNGVQRFVQFFLHVLSLRTWSMRDRLM